MAILQTSLPPPPLHSPLLYHLFFSSYAHTPCCCVEKLVRFINRSLRCSGWGNFQLSLIGKYGLQLRLSQSKQLGWRSINMAEESSERRGEGSKRNGNWNWNWKKWKLSQRFRLRLLRLLRKQNIKEKQSKAKQKKKQNTNKSQRRKQQQKQKKKENYGIKINKCAKSEQKWNET